MAVELSKTTKILAFNENASYAFSLNAGDVDVNVHLGDSLQWEFGRRGSALELGATVDIPTDEPDNPVSLPGSLILSERFPQLLGQIFSHANRPDDTGAEVSLLAVLNLPTATDQEVALALYRRLRGYIASGRNNVWHWYIANLIQPLRLAQLPATRLVGNPPWVVYNAMANDRQDTFRGHASARGLWAGANLATQNDLAATFVATCVDFYFKVGGKFGFVLPYAALRARHWANFRTGDWSLRQDTEQGTHVDLSADVWDFNGVQAPPFPQANSSVIFGTKAPANRQDPGYKALARIREQAGTGIDTRMAWDDVKPLLTYSYRKEWPTSPSPAYADAFRNGATLFPQSLVVFEEPKSRARGVVYFRTNSAKGAWKGTERDGQVEGRFVKPALFSRLLLPFGTSRYSHVIAPLSNDDAEVLRDFPQGDGVRQFNLYWSSANADYVQIKSPKSPDSLADRIDLFGNFSAQLGSVGNFKTVYNASGSNLVAAVVSSDVVTSHNTYYLCSDDKINHYLAAIFNAECLAEFFKEARRASDRDFMLLPFQNLPIPAYDAGNEHHANLAAQSQLAHERVAALVAGRQASGRRINRSDVLRDEAMQPILASIDASVRAILPEFCS